MKMGENGWDCGCVVLHRHGVIERRQGLHQFDRSLYLVVG